MKIATKTACRGNRLGFFIIIILIVLRYKILKNNLSFNFSWKELLPQIFKIVSEIKVLTADGLEMTGAEYQEMIITDICRCKVQLNITVPLALMFR